jgi:hypothetical protein
MQIKGILPSPLLGLLKRLLSILGLRAALQRFTPGYCSFSASGAKKYAAVGETPALPKIANIFMRHRARHEVA